MKSIEVAALVTGLALASPSPAGTQPPTNAVAAPGLGKTILPSEVLKSLVGSWEGTCRTWLRPDALADESKVKGVFRPVLDGPFVRHTYGATIQGRPRHGEETLAFNPITKRFQVAWVDDFHMNYAIMFSEGEGTARGFVVKGTYEAATNAAAWGWKTVYEIVDDDRLTITAYNITPYGQEAKAVETEYRRTGP